MYQFLDIELTKHRGFTKEKPKLKKTEIISNSEGTGHKTSVPHLTRSKL